ncbi:hypothetical protein DV736_g3433, partial [Chaetothyriales sp. CBS 134916]
MGEKKRKDLPADSDGPKKSKKVKILAGSAPAAVSELAEAPIKTKATKKGRRGRAADYMGGGDEDADNSSAPPAAANNAPSSKSSSEGKKRGKGKKSKHSNDDETLTADGANGIIEHAETKEVEPMPGSMQAEAQHTVDAELREEYGPGEVETTETADLGAALLAGFDSDTSDHAEDTGLDIKNLGGIPHYKKTKKKLSKITKSGTDKPGVIYVGRIPHGFYEHQMREYFSQFGDVTRLRLSRNRRTGASKHFAFVEFASEEVAKIVAETMDSYLMFGHILKCKFAPDENLHPEVWKGANKKFRKIPHEKLERQKLEGSKTIDHWRKKNEKETKKRGRKAKVLKEKLGYDAPIVQLAEPASALKLNQLDAQETKAIELAPAEEVSPAAFIETSTETAVSGDVVTEPTQDREEQKIPKDKLEDVNLPAKAAPVSHVPIAAPEAKKAAKKAKKEVKVETERAKKTKTQV